MFEEWLIEWNEMILQLGAFINLILSIPSQIHPLLSPNMILVAVSVLFGYFFSEKAEFGFKTLSTVVFAILFFCTIKFIGGA